MNQSTIETIWDALRTIQDPELGFSIVDLGLVYAVILQATDDVLITMTLTTPVCPLQDHFQTAISQALQSVGIQDNWQLEFTFTPPWSLSKANPDVQQHFALLGIPLSRF